jgi:hypothetical protein
MAQAIRRPSAARPHQATATASMIRHQEVAPSKAISRPEDRMASLYPFVDGIAERLRPGAKREPVLAAWGFTIEGRRVLLHMVAASKEDAETVTAFFEDMKRRGLNPLNRNAHRPSVRCSAIRMCKASK